MMDFRLGVFCYSVALVEPPVLLDGVARDAVWRPGRDVIEIDRTLRPAKRVGRFWHELFHAMSDEWDCHHADPRGEEVVCDLLGLVMAHLTPRDYARLQCYLRTGIASDAVLMTPGLAEPIPVIAMTES